MACGCPVVISEQPALMEICGNAALRCRADDTDQISRHMQTLYADAGLRERLAAAGRQRAQKFTWAVTASFLLDHCLALDAKTDGVT